GQVRLVNGSTVQGGVRPVAASSYCLPPTDRKQPGDADKVMGWVLPQQLPVREEGKVVPRLHNEMDAIGQGRDLVLEGVPVHGPQRDRWAADAVQPARGVLLEEGVVWPTTWIEHNEPVGAAGSIFRVRPPRRATEGVCRCGRERCQGDEQGEGER